MLSIAADANANLAANLYADVLGRLPSAPELGYWRDQLAARTPRDAVVVGFVQSVEHRQNVIDGLYAEFLARPAETSGRNYWTGVLGQGASEFKLLALIIGSDEYFRNHGGDEAGFIRGLYREVLHRSDPPGTSEIGYWAGVLGGGTPRSDVALGFINSPEFIGVGVDQMYRDFLRRDADAGGRAYWLGRFQQGATTLEIQRFLLDSSEYSDLAQLHLEPGSTLTLLGSQIDPTGELLVEFSDQHGFKLDVPPVRATNLDVTVGVPPLIDPSTGELAAGTVSVQLLQNSRPVTSATIGALQIENLPQSPFPTGQVISAYLGGAIRALQQDIDQLSGTAFDSASFRAALTAQMANLNLLAADVHAVMADPTKSFNLGQFGGHDVTLGSAQLAALDRLTLAALDGIVRAAGGTPPAAAAVSVAPAAAIQGAYASADPVPLPSDDLVVRSFRARTDPKDDTIYPVFYVRVEDDQLESVHMVGEVLYEIGKEAMFSVGHVAYEYPNILAFPATYYIFGAGMLISVAGYKIEHLSGDDLARVRAAVDDARRFATNAIDEALGKSSGAINGFFADLGGAFDQFQKAGPPGQIIVKAAPNLTTHEVLQDQVQFDVRLTKKPTDTVSVNLHNGAPQEGQMSPSFLLFNPTNWTFPQRVTITAINRFVADGNQTYNVTLDPAASNDPAYNGVRPAPNTVSITNIDDYHAGVLVTPTSGLVTTEDGGQAQFTIRLTSKPLFPVTIILVSSNTAEGDVSPGDVTFTSADWDVPHLFTVTGVPDGVRDGNVAYTINTTRTGSQDPAYNVLDVPDVSVVNLDNGIQLPTPDTTGVWQGTFSETNPLGTISGGMTISIRAFPKYTTVVTGTITTGGSGSVDFVGTVSGPRLVFNISPTPAGFYLDQLVGTVIGNTMQGTITIIDTSGGTTKGKFQLSKVS